MSGYHQKHFHHTHTQLTQYVGKYCLNKNHRGTSIVKKLSFSMFMKMEQMEDGGEADLADLLSDHIILPSFLKPMKDMVRRMITPEMILELVESYISDGGRQTFRCIVDPDSEEVLSELSHDDYSEMIHYIDDMSMDHSNED